MDEWVRTLGTLLGGGALLGIVQAILNHKQKGSRESYDEWAKIVKTQREELTDARARIEALEKAKDVCNEEVARLSLEIHGMRSVVTRVTAGNLGAMVQCDEDGRIIEWNAAATSLLHWPRVEALKLHAREIVPARLREQFDAVFAEAVKEKRGPQINSFETFVVTSEGQDVAVTALLNSWTHKGRRTYEAEFRPR